MMLFEFGLDFAKVLRRRDDFLVRTKNFDARSKMRWQRMPIPRFGRNFFTVSFVNEFAQRLEKAVIAHLKFSRDFLRFRLQWHQRHAQRFWKTTQEMLNLF